MTPKQTIKGFTWSRLLGFIQSDGHISFELTDGTFNPRIHITVTEKRRPLIERISSFLRKEGLVVQEQLSKPEKDKDWTHGTNILIERQRNIKNFLDKVKPLEENLFPPVSLFDYKKRDLELLKAALEINKQKQLSRNLEEKLKCTYKILDIKEQMFKFHVGKRIKTPKEIAAMLKVSDLSLVEGAASSIVIACEQQILEFQTKFLKESEKWKTIDDVPFEVGEFLAGVFEGDGCFQFIINCQDPEKNEDFKRPFVGITPKISLTNQKEGLEAIDPIFLLANNVFRQGKMLSVHDKHKQKQNARGWTCSATEDLEQRVVPFFRKFGFCSEHALERFELLAEFVNQKEIILKNEGKFKDFVSKLYENPHFYHETPIEEVFDLIGKHFAYERDKIKKI